MSDELYVIYKNGERFRMKHGQNAYRRAKDARKQITELIMPLVIEEARSESKVTGEDMWKIYHNPDFVINTTDRVRREQGYEIKVYTPTGEVSCDGKTS